MLKHRSFPRYNVKNYSLNIIFENEEHNEVKIIDTSLSGLNLQYKSDTHIADSQEIIIQYKTYNFKMNINRKWSVNSTNQEFSKSGFEVKFDKIDEYKKWLLFIKSLHQLNLKN